MRNDFCAFILTHGRPDRVHTYNTLLKSGYTGKIYIVIDDEDPTAEEYRKRFGNTVLQFCKSEAASKIDEGDNFQDRRAIVYARNACWDLAEQAGCKFFIQLDDDYTSFSIRWKGDGERCCVNITQIDRVLELMVGFLENTPCYTVAMSQAGDWQGGQIVNGDRLTGGNKATLRRKAMNSFVCSTDRPFQFFGRINEDVNTYVTLGRMGALFFTVMQVALVQIQTQSNSGGMSGLYLDSGTYLKSFYSVMYSPSCVQIGTMGDPRSPHRRIHHKINWSKAVPKILSEEHRKKYG